MKLDGQTLDVQCVSCSGESRNQEPDLLVESVLTDVLVIFFLIRFGLVVLVFGECLVCLQEQHN